MKTLTTSNLDILNNILGTNYLSEKEAQDDLINPKFLEDYHSGDVLFVKLSDSITNEPLKYSDKKKAIGLIFSLTESIKKQGNIGLALEILHSDTILTLKRLDFILDSMKNMFKYFNKTLDINKKEEENHTINSVFNKSNKVGSEFINYILVYVLTRKAKELLYESTDYLDINGYRLNTENKQNVVLMICYLINATKHEYPLKANQHKHLVNFCVSKLKDYTHSRYGCEPYKETRKWAVKKVTELDDKTLEMCIKELVLVYRDINSDYNHEKFLFAEEYYLVDTLYLGLFKALKNKDLELLNTISYLFYQRKTLIH